MQKFDADNKEFIESIGNSSRIKILATLWKFDEELNVYKICRHTGLGRKAVNLHLNKLILNKLVSKKAYGSITLYTLNERNPKLIALVEFFKKAGL